MTSKAEVLETLATIQGTVDEIKAESTTSLAKITELEALVAAGGAIDPAIVDKLAELKASVQAVADLVPNAGTGTGSPADGGGADPTPPEDGGGIVA